MFGDVYVGKFHMQGAGEVSEVGVDQSGSGKLQPTPHTTSLRCDAISPP